MTFMRGLTLIVAFLVRPSKQIAKIDVSHILCDCRQCYLKARLSK